MTTDSRAAGSGRPAWDPLRRRRARRKEGRTQVLASRPHGPRTKDEQAVAVVHRYALRCGAVGALGSAAGPAVVGLRAGVVSCAALQARMVLEVASVYGRALAAEDFETDLLLLLAGDSAKEVIRRAGVGLAQQAAADAVRRAAWRSALRRLGPYAMPGTVVQVLPAHTALARLVPLAGTPASFAIDYAYARAVGIRAITLYRRRAAFENGYAARR